MRYSLNVVLEFPRAVGAFNANVFTLNLTMKHTLSAHFLLLIYGVIGWFLGAVAWRTCGRVCAASGMGATTQRKKLAYNVRCYDQCPIINR